MNIEVGDYIRTKYGKIGKVTGFEKALVFKPTNFKEDLEDVKSEEIQIVVDTNYNFDDEKDSYFKDDIVKSSSKIIDLIQVGDIVNGREINGIDPPQHRCFNRIYSDIGFTVYTEFKNKDIKTVVTKEQIKEMEYKL